MKDINELGDMDIFFYYSQNDIQLENENDLMAGLIQSARSLFYNRRDSAGISQRENFPIALMLNVLVKFDVVSWVGFRNTYVTNGSNGEKDRRLGVSQNFINIQQNKKGSIDVNVLYIPFNDFSKKDTVTIPIGG